MNARARAALEESIEKWRQVERGEIADLGGENCALCGEFYGVYDADGVCSECPVALAVKDTDCSGTPYIAWFDAQEALGRRRSKGEWIADTPELVELAKAERKFLESLK
jgi:hypothetical protein